MQARTQRQILCCATMRKAPQGKHAVEGGRLTSVGQARPTSRHCYLQSHSDRIDPSQARPQNIRLRRHPVYRRNRSRSLHRGRARVLLHPRLPSQAPLDAEIRESRPVLEGARGLRLCLHEAFDHPPLVLHHLQREQFEAKKRRAQLTERCATRVPVQRKRNGRKSGASLAGYMSHTTTSDSRRMHHALSETALITVSREVCLERTQPSTSALCRFEPNIRTTP